jgi:endonuclease/exonuclease/phosphatase family metal-dependent hydrolase
LALLSPRQKRIRWALRIAGGLLAFVLAWYLLGRVGSLWRECKLISAGAVAEKGAAPAEIRLVVWNVAHGRGATAGNWGGGSRADKLARLRAVAALIAAQKPDAVVLNEVDFEASWSGRVNQAEVISREAKLSNRAEERNVDVTLPLLKFRFGNAVLSRFPITDARVVRFPGYSKLETFGAGRKKGLLCTLELPGGRRVRLLGVHLEHRSEEVRIAGARAIERARLASKTPMIAAGDFNSCPPGYPRASPDAEGRTALSLLLDGGGFVTSLKKSPGAPDMTFPSTSPDRAIDWVLAPAGWRILEHRPLDSKLSDHLPVFARVAVPANP